MYGWAYIPDGMQLTCKSFSVANSQGGADRIASANCVLRTGVTLDVTQAGMPIGLMADGISNLPGLRDLSINIGDMICLSSTGKPGSIPACANFPQALDNYCENGTYPNMGFVGYISNISLRADAGTSEIDINLADEAWMWNRFVMPPLRFNYNDATKTPMRIGQVRANGYSVYEIIQFFQELLRRYGHSAFNIGYASIGDRIADPSITNFTDATVWQAFSKLIAATYGSAVRIYSPGAGYVELRRVSTSQGVLSDIKIDKTNLIDNAMEIKDRDETNRKVDTVVGFGDTVKYYVGNAQIDNELVPAWDWWNDGYFLVINNQTGQPATYQDSAGLFELVNPFYINATLDDSNSVKFLPPDSSDASNIPVFAYNGGACTDEAYPHYTTFLTVFNAHPVSRYCHVTTYAMDSYLSDGRSRPLHEGRFKRWRLKDNQPHLGKENLHGPGGVADFLYYDNEVYPRRLWGGQPKAFSGDPMGLNEAGMAKNVYHINGIASNHAYTCHIAQEFMNTATHRILRQRLKPGRYADGSDGFDDSAYEQIVDPNRPGEFIEDTTQTHPIFVKYDLITNILSQDDLNKLGSYDATPYTAERVEVDFKIENYFVQTSQPLVVMTSTLDRASFRKENPTHNYARTTRNGYDAGDPAYDIYRIFNPMLQDAKAPIQSETSQQPLVWYYPLRHGRFPVESVIPHQDEYPVYHTSAELVGWAKGAVPFAIPRIEFYGFVYYEDKPELEGQDILADLNSYYWRDIRSCMVYPESAMLTGANIITLPTTNNQTMERQIGGTYDYEHMTNNDLDVARNTKYEYITYYRSKELGTALSFNIQNQSQEQLGSHKVSFKFTLYNVQYRFNEKADDFITGRIPAAVTTYYERTDIKPENGGSNIGIFQVEHSLEGGWSVKVTYGGGVPKLRDLYDDQIKAKGVIRDLVEAQSKNRLVTLSGVEAYGRYSK